MAFRSSLPQPHSSILLIPLRLSTFKRTSSFGRGRKAGDVSDPPPPVRLSSPQPRAGPATAALRLGCAIFAAPQRNKPVRCPLRRERRVERRGKWWFWD